MTSNGLAKSSLAKSSLVNGGELCVRTLKQAGVGHAFVLHGGHLDPIFQACLDHDIHLIDMRHEAAAGHAADAYARQTGQCAVAMVTAGPGYTNAITAITQAYLDCTPILFIIGAAPLRDAERLPLQGGIDQIAMARPVTKWACQVTRTELIPNLVAQAMRETTNGQPGPVVLEIPIDVLFDRVPEDKVSMPGDITTFRPPAPSADTVEQAIELLCAAERPAIICGGGMLYARAADKLLAFAQKSGIPVYTNNKARGVIAHDDPHYAGALTNIMVSQAANLGSPDVVLTLGLRFGMFTEPGMLGPGRIPNDECKIIQVDVSRSEMGRIRPVDLAVVADAGEMLDALLAATSSSGWPDWKAWTASQHNLTNWHVEAYREATGKTSLLHPYAAVAEIIKALPSGTIICADGGEASGWVEMLAQPSSTGQLMSHGYLGCLGIGMPFAIGAQLANPEQPVVVIVGDGSVGFHIQEFDTMVRHNLPIVTIVLNNKAWGMCVHGQQSMFGDNRLVVTTLGNAHYEQVAAGFGCHDEYVEREEEIAGAIKRAFAHGQTACINIITDLEAALGDTRGEKITRVEDREGEISMPYYDNLKNDNLKKDKTEKVES